MGREGGGGRGGGFRSTARTRGAEVCAAEPVCVAGVVGDGRREAAVTRLRTSNYAAVYLRYRVPASGGLQAPSLAPHFL